MKPRLEDLDRSQLLEMVYVLRAEIADLTIRVEDLEAIRAIDVASIKRYSHVVMTRALCVESRKN